jgi:hypothetical protein
LYPEYFKKVLPIIKEAIYKDNSQDGACLGVGISSWVKDVSPIPPILGWGMLVHSP